MSQKGLTPLGHPASDPPERLLDALQLLRLLGEFLELSLERRDVLVQRVDGGARVGSEAIGWRCGSTWW